MPKIKRLLSPNTTPIWLKLTIDVAAVALIGWVAWQYAGFLLRDDLYLYGDHPGQFYRLWQLLQITWPEDGSLIGWSPYWYAGFPELQFYPPGFALIGWLIWLGSFPQLSPVAIYQLVVFISYLLPAIGFYLLLAWGFGDRLAGLFAAWLTLVAPLPLGGALGVKIGLLGDRLAFGLTPLYILAGLWGMRSRNKVLPWLVSGLALAGIGLNHTYQAILPTGILVLYALIGGTERRSRLIWLGGVILLGLGLTAFWGLPLAARQDFFVPIIEAPLLETQIILKNMWFNGAGWLLAAALVGNLLRPGERRNLTLAILLGALLQLGFIFFDYEVLIDRFNIFAFIPNRFVTGLTFGLFVGLGLGVSELSWLGVRLLRRRSLARWGLPLLVIVPWLAYHYLADAYDTADWLDDWPPAADRTPLFLSEAEARYDLQPVWAAMAATPGRILFTSYYGLLFDLPTTLKSVTPVLTGRPILGGTFTTRTLVANYLWYGQAKPAVLYGKVEQQDDRTLAGIPWEVMSDDFLAELAHRFNVTLIATTATDVNAQAFLDGSARFRPGWSNRLFKFYEPVDYQPSWVESTQAEATVTRFERQAIDVAVTEARPGATVRVKVANYPLWQAEAEGQSLPIQTDEQGLMLIKLPPGSYTLQLRYQPGWAEWLGGIITLATLAAAVGLVIYHYLLSFNRRHLGHVE